MRSSSSRAVYGIPSWPRLVLACRMTDAIWRDDVDAVRALVAKTSGAPRRGRARTSAATGGPPMSYAANLGRDRIIAMLHERAARRTCSTRFERACLQGRIDTARRLPCRWARVRRETR
jgi:hypothetical protein